MAVSSVLSVLSVGDELTLVCGRAGRGGLPTGKRQGWKNVPVQVIVDVEVTGKTGAGVLGLVPRPVVLTIQQECSAACARGIVAEAGKLERQHRPSRLRRRARADTRERLVHVRVTRLTPAAIGVLYAKHPFGGVANHVSADVERDQCADHAPRAVDVVDAPAAVPRSPGALRRAKVR